MESKPICYTTDTKQRAEVANDYFDELVKQYLRDWIGHGTVTSLPDELSSGDAAHDLDEFVETGALRSFFKHHDDALALLLAHEGIAKHLLRSGTDVYFEPDAYEPLLAKFERRIYNLAAHREHLEVPFRYSPTSRQGAHGDSIGWTDLPLDHTVREDIGYYFGTRRSDETALNILARQLHREAELADGMPVYAVTEGYMHESLQAIKTATETLQTAGNEQFHCFVVQRRHAANDRHLGAALLVMHPSQPNNPLRIIFCDTLTPNGQPPWWNTFRNTVDAVFPQEEGARPVSDKLEDGGLNLQRLHDGVPVRHQDIDCAFYSASIARALIQLAVQFPDLITSGSIDAIVHEMTSRMPDYFVEANIAKSPTTVREINIIRRWNTGREALLAIREQKAER
ncbi:hypothetical protein J2I47_20530 [Fibrella sp. HMF5335]|uniref:Uncharacterized protein n=2 Tax=Fibrella rubiginis TaxID=2817060 RepID=A0A939K730_9BACT|nr:hypothetical protein [Fibrella rubiginis]